MAFCGALLYDVGTFIFLTFCNAASLLPLLPQTHETFYFFSDFLSPNSDPISISISISISSREPSWLRSSPLVLEVWDALEATVYFIPCIYFIEFFQTCNPLNKSYIFNSHSLLYLIEEKQGGELKSAMNYRKREERMGVAFRHLCPLGFSKSLIRRKVNSLLKIYGNQGWVFFEEDAYKVLIDVILEQQEEPYLNNGFKDIEAASTSNQQLKQVVEIEQTCIEPELERWSQCDKEPVTQSVLIAAEEGGGKRWEDVPEDILVHIFSKGLNRPSLYSTQQVCRSWRSACRGHPPIQKRTDAYRTSWIAYYQSLVELSLVLQKCFGKRD